MVLSITPARRNRHQHRCALINKQRVSVARNVRQARLHHVGVKHRNIIVAFNIALQRSENGEGRKWHRRRCDGNDSGAPRRIFGVMPAPLCRRRA